MSSIAGDGLNKFVLLWVFPRYPHAYNIVMYGFIILVYCIKLYLTFKVFTSAILLFIGMTIRYVGAFL